MFAVFVVIFLIFGGLKLFFVLWPKLLKQKKAAELNETNITKNISSSGQSGGITAERVTINNPLVLNTVSPLSNMSSIGEIDKKNREIIKNKLKRLYGELCVLSDHPFPTGDVEALQDYENQVNKWVSDTSMWIEMNIGFGAREKFLNRGEGGHFGPSNYDEQLNNLLSDIKRYKLGLEELIKSDEMWFENKNSKKLSKKNK